MIGKRIELDGANTERGGQQFVNGRAFAKDGYTRIHRIEPAGFASSPIKGAKAFLVAPNGDADQAYVFGGEHPGHRPAGIPSGATALYDHNGNVIKLWMAEVVMDFGSRTITMTGGEWKIAGKVTITGNLEVVGNIHATGTIIDELGNTNHHSH
ncbi:phage gp45-like [Rhizobium sp. BK181]|uniref:phage baseplate assembly protein domain-containing protein n=1 Tax=Rhizobium sp. BK181 TaxID=2587072 RepID=UPI0016082B05|nr:phage baseplate assembly protein [Rhizobium sp. BK181]MBB3315111.1 phage gp45-like [Rhizobium sp. BK181]